MFYLTVSVWGSVSQLKEAAEKFGRVNLARFFVTYPYLIYSPQTFNRVIADLKATAKTVSFGLDSGGFVEKVKLDRNRPNPTVINYACFLKAHGGLFDIALSWDFGDANQCWEAFQFLTRQNLKVTPVWHIGDPPDLLTDYCKKSEWVAVGGFGLLGRHNAKMTALFTHLAALLSHHKERFGTKFHGLGVGFNQTLLTVWSPDSADSTTPLQCLRYGYLVTVKDDKIIRKWFKELTPDLLPVPLEDFKRLPKLRTLVVAHAALKVTELLNLIGWGAINDE